MVIPETQATGYRRKRIQINKTTLKSIKMNPDESEISTVPDFFKYDIHLVTRSKFR